MTAKHIAKLGKLLARFLTQFADCFARPAGDSKQNKVNSIMNGSKRLQLPELNQFAELLFDFSSHCSAADQHAQFHVDCEGLLSQIG
jgi:hypothetical protein